MADEADTNSSVPSEENIFEACRSLPPADRVAYLDKACAGNTNLRRQAEALLKSYGEAETFLEASPINKGPEDTNKIDPTITEKPGDHIGHYKLLQQIGEGGCGVVYMAEQDEPVRRKVALKVIKLGMDTKSVIARFEAERQALALMDHPNIAKVLEAGATASGRPYFVMELVHGIKITDFCDKHHLSTRERLGLFIQVCGAIQHAHQKGIIHRDIKPSNVLVTLNDGVPLPKVIDFGIAKSTQQRLTDKTLFTAFEQFIGTPAYMSPEQAEMNAQGVDTRSDIYSLGVLLYELLTGKTPFVAEDLLAAGLDEIRRIIREEEPMRPSTRLSTMIEGDLVLTARHRCADPAKLSTLIRGDLDWIAMKALEKDRIRRYDTASGFAMDVQRYLNDEPVVARPPSATYRLQKLVRRNKLLCAAVGAVATTLILGIIASTQEAVRASRSEKAQSRLRTEAQADAKRAEASAIKEGQQRQVARTEAKKSQHLARFLEEVIEGVAPEVARGRDTTILKEVLAGTAARIDKDFTEEPEIEAELRNTLARSYMALGLWYQAEDMAGQAAGLAEKHFGKQSTFYVEALAVLAKVRAERSDWISAEKAGREALQIGSNVFNGDNLTMAACKGVVAYVQLQDHRDTDETLDLLRQSLAAYQRLLGNENPQVANSLRNLADALADHGQFAEADLLFVRALDMSRKLFGGEDIRVAMCLNTYAIALGVQGKTMEQEKAYREALTIFQRVEGPPHTMTHRVINNLAHALANRGKEIEAENLYRTETPDDYSGLAVLLRDEHKFVEADACYGKFIEATRRQQPPDERILTDGLSSILVNMQYAKTFARDEPYAREYVAIKEKQTQRDYPWYLAHSQLGICLLGQKKYAESEPLLILSYAGMKARAKASPKNQARIHETIEHLIQLYRETGKNEQAEKWKQEWVALLEGEIADFRTNSLANPSMKAVTLGHLAPALFDLGKFEESESVAREYLNLCDKKFPGQAEFYYAQCLLGQNLFHRQQTSEAETWLISGCNGLPHKSVDMDLTDQARQTLHSSLQILVQLYQTTGRPSLASPWEKRLTDEHNDSSR